MKTAHSLLWLTWWAFLGAKLSGAVDWNWLYVASPLYALIVIYCVMMALLAVTGAVVINAASKENKKSAFLSDIAKRANEEK